MSYRQALLSQERIFQEEVYKTLLRQDEGDPEPHLFFPSSDFKFIVVTTNPCPPTLRTHFAVIVVDGGLPNANGEGLSDFAHCCHLRLVQYAVSDHTAPTRLIILECGGRHSLCNVSGPLQETVTLRGAPTSQRMTQSAQYLVPTKRYPQSCYRTIRCCVFTWSVQLIYFCVSAWATGRSFA